MPADTGLIQALIIETFNVRLYRFKRPSTGLQARWLYHQTGGVEYPRLEGVWVRYSSVCAVNSFNNLQFVFFLIDLCAKAVCRHCLKHIKLYPGLRDPGFLCAKLDSIRPWFAM